MSRLFEIKTSVDNCLLWITLKKVHFGGYFRQFFSKIANLGQTETKLLIQMGLLDS